MLDPIIIGQIGWTSLATTSYYVLFAVAFALVLKVNRVFNFAQAATMNVAFYAGFTAINLLSLPLYVGIAASLVAALLFSWLIETYGFAVLRKKNASMLFVFIFTFIVSEFVAYVMMFVFGTWPPDVVLHVDVARLHHRQHRRQRLGCSGDLGRDGKLRRAVRLSAIYALGSIRHCGLR